jgi:beta-glucuronidase
MLYPHPSSTREHIDLGGTWDFRPDAEDAGLAAQWAARPLPAARPMPVPASYDAIDPHLRDFIGPVWYQLAVTVPPNWQGQDIELRFGAVAHAARVFWDGTEIAQHVGGFLPFTVALKERARPGQRHLLTVRVDNRLGWDYLPHVDRQVSGPPLHPPGTGRYNFWGDFHNFCGIHRRVVLSALPKRRIHGLCFTPGKDGDTGLLGWEVEADAGQVRLRLLHGSDVVATGKDTRGRLTIPNCRFWYPGAPELYDVEVELLDDAGTVLDQYRMPIGIRTVRIDGSRFLVNDRPVLLRGAGRHEDSDLLGRGHSDAVTCQDAALLHWLGGNSWRTAHYPHAEEELQLCDRLGIALVDEAQVVGLHWGKLQQDQELLGRVSTFHRRVVEQLVIRDRNHACVLVWSLGNEIDLAHPLATPTLSPIVDRCRELDPHRPVTFNAQTEDPAHMPPYLDLLCIGSYVGWYHSPPPYSEAGDLRAAIWRVERALRAMHDVHRKPILVLEFGADSVAGIHSNPGTFFSEEFQAAFIRAYVEMYARLDFVIGTHVWTFADFAAKNESKRVDGNRKGLFTRDRRPKLAAHVLRALWTGRGLMAAVESADPPTTRHPTPETLNGRNKQ